MNYDIAMDDSLDEVTLGSSCYKEDSDVVLKKINCKYTQKNSIKGVIRRFALFDNIYLYCRIQFNFKKIPEHRIDLTFLNDKPEKKLHIAWKFMLTAVVCLLTAITIYKLEYMSQLFGQQLHMPVVIMLGTVSFIMLLLLFYRSYYHLVFMSYAGGVPLLSLSYKPWDKKCKKFVEVLQKNINYAHNRSGVTRQVRIVDEMKDLRRLEKIGIISNKDYNRAQKKILASKT